MSLFKYAISVWGCACYSKYLSRIDKLQNRAIRFGYLRNITPVKELIEASDTRLWENITSSPKHPLFHLLPLKRTRILRERGHDFIPPRVKTERFKKVFLNRCIFNYI